MPFLRGEPVLALTRPALLQACEMQLQLIILAVQSFNYDPRPYDGQELNMLREVFSLTARLSDELLLLKPEESTG